MSVCLKTGRLCACVAQCDLTTYKRALSSYSKAFTCRLQSVCQYCYCYNTQVNVLDGVRGFSLRWYAAQRRDRPRHPWLIQTNSSRGDSSLCDATGCIQ